MKLTLSFLTSCSLVLFSVMAFTSAAGAAEQVTPEKGSFHSSIGTFGAGLAYGQRHTAKWASRFGVNTGFSGKIKGDTEINGIRYEAKVKTNPSVSALADYFPIDGSGFRVSGGLMYVGLQSDLTGRADDNGNYSINDRTYTSTQVGSLAGQIKFNTLTPYFGVGWESRRFGESGWRFISDAGLFYYGKAKVRLSASGASSNAALQNDIEAERHQLERKGVGLGLSVGAAYAF